MSKSVVQTLLECWCAWIHYFTGELLLVPNHVFGEEHFPNQSQIIPCWKGSQGSPGPTILSKSAISARWPSTISVQSVQCWGNHHFSGEAIPVSDCSHCEKFFSCEQSESPQEWLVSTKPCLFCITACKKCYRRASFYSGSKKPIVSRNAKLLCYSTNRKSFS